TRFSRDWSSDVCSSDLPDPQPAGGRHRGAASRRRAPRQAVLPARTDRQGRPDSRKSLIVAGEGPPLIRAAVRRHPPTGRWTGALAAAAWMFAAAALAQQAPAPVVIPPAIDAGASSSADQSPRRRAQDSDAGFRLDLNLGLDGGGPPAARNEQRGGTRADLLSDGLERAGWLQRAGALGLAERVLIDGRPALERTDE